MPTVTASFEYDALGRRVSKTINGITTEYHYDGNDIVAEIGSGAVYLGPISLMVYWKVRILKSYLYQGITCFLIIILYASEYLLKEEWPILTQLLLIALLLFFAIWVGRTATVESGIYSILRKKTGWTTLLVGKAPIFLLDHEKIEPTTSRVKGITWGCFLIVFPFLAWPFLNNPLSGVMILGSAGIATNIYSLVYLK